MEWTRLGTTPRYLGASTEPKPVYLIERGATALEVDTGDLYVYDGTNWNLKPPKAELPKGVDDLFGSNTPGHVTGDFLVEEGDEV